MNPRPAEIKSGIRNSKWSSDSGIRSISVLLRSDRLTPINLMTNQSYPLKGTDGEEVLRTFQMGF